MNRFVFGTNEQFAALKQSLQDDLCHVYKDCVLPAGFSRNLCRIGFEKCQSDHSSYKLLIDNGIQYSRSTRNHALLKIWLQNGELVFLDFNDLKEFLTGLRFLY